MTTTNGDGPMPRHFEHHQRVPIADLTPGQVDLTASYIEARIALVWPYSSSTRQYAFLLSEADIRPLNARRQLKVTLHNGVARTVQAAKVGIGDTVKLSLRGCQWSDAKDETATPGKRNHWDISFRNAVTLEVNRDGSQEPQVVQYESIQTTVANGAKEINGVVAQVAEPPTEDTPLRFPLNSPRLLNSTGSVPHLYRPVHDPFLDELEHDGGRTRKRTKFARNSGAWQLLDDETDAVQSIPSPSKGQGNQKLNRDASAVQPDELIGTRMIDGSTDTHRNAVIHPEPTSVSDVAIDQLQSATGHRSSPLPAILGSGRHNRQPSSSPPTTPLRQSHTIIDLSSPLGSPQRDIPASGPGFSTASRQFSSPLEASTQPGPVEVLHSSSPMSASAPQNERRASPLGSLPQTPPGHQRGGLSPSVQLSGPNSHDHQARSSLEEPPVSPRVDVAPIIELAPSNPSMLANTTSPERSPLVESALIQPDDAESNKTVQPPSDLEISGATDRNEHDVIRMQTLMEGERANAMGPPETQPPMSNASRTLPAAQSLDTSIRAIKQSGVASGYLLQMADHASDQAHDLRSVEAPMRTNDADLVERINPPQLSGDSGQETMARASAVTSAAAAVMNAAAPMSGLDVQSTPENSRDALAFLEEFLQMSPVLETQSSQLKTIDGPGTETRTAGASESLAIIEQQSLSEERPPVIDKSLSAAIRSTSANEEHDAALVGRTPPKDARQLTMDGSVDRIDDERVESVSDRQGVFDRVNPIVRDTHERVIVDNDHQPRDHGFVGILSSKKDSTNNTTLLPAETQLPTPAATQLQSEDHLVAEAPPNIATLDYPQTPRQILSLADDRGAQGTASMRNERDAGAEWPKASTAEQVAPSTLRRVSQRLTRTSIAPIKIDSPFFSSTKPAQVTPPQSEAHEPLVHQAARAVKNIGLQETRAGIRTYFGYYPSLSTLSEYYGQQVDVIAVCVHGSTKPMHAKKGPRDWYTTLKLADCDATADESPISVQIFRPYKAALPTASKGDVLILRCFKVQTLKHRWMLLSTDEAAWAVFKPSSTKELSSESVEMTGPHLEYGAQEFDYCQDLSQWWGMQNQKPTEVDPENADGTIQPQDGHDNESQAREEFIPSIIPSIEGTGPSSPRRSRRINDSASMDDATGQRLLSLTPDPVKPATKAPTRQQPSRRARNKTPTPFVQPSKNSTGTPFIAISEASAPAFSPPISPRRSRRRTRSTLSPNPSTVSNVISITSSADLPIASPVRQPQSRPLPQPAAKGSRTNKDKGIARAIHHSSSEPEQDEAEENPPLQATQGTERAHSSPTRMTRSKRRTVSPPLVHELRDGMRYVDEGAADQDGDESNKKGVITTQRRKGLRSEDVHELRDGLRYVDE